ncbi:HP1 family phage holin [Yersinia wautersii]|uniref:HP1 family phage holin n=1 Tax=Yersinia pseudotuberculosis TaxID=633 RepID=UPI0035A91E74
MRMDKYSSGSSYGWGAFTVMLGSLSLNEWATFRCHRYRYQQAYFLTASLQRYPRY